MWLEDSNLEFVQLLGIEDVAEIYCNELTPVERENFRDNFVLLFSSCLHIITVGSAPKLSKYKNEILAGWLKDPTRTTLHVHCEFIYFIVEKANDGRLWVTRIGRYS